MFKINKKLAIIPLIFALGILTSYLFVEAKTESSLGSGGSIRTIDTSVITRVRNAIVPTIPTDTLGDSTTRWANGFFTALDVTALTVGAFASGDLTVAGDLFVNSNQINLGTGTATSTISGGFGIGVGTTTPGAAFAVATGTASVNTAALISNLGTGLSFVVEDVANDTSPFVISADGNVGIGTNNPAYKLEVTGAIASSDGIAGGTILQQTFAGNDGIFQTVNADNIVFRPNQVEALRLNVGGNVGVGTTSPQNTFHVLSANAGVAAFDKSGLKGAFLEFKSAATTKGYLNWDVTADGGANGNNVILQNDVSGGALQLVVRNSGGTRNFSAFYLDPTGNVGIGTNTPSSLTSIQSSAATSTLHLGTGGSTSFGSCIQLYAASGTPYRLYIDGETSVGGNDALRVEKGGCGEQTPSP